MVLYLSLLSLLAAIQAHKVGLLLNSGSTVVGSIRDVAEFTLTNLDNRTEVELVMREYGSTYLSVLDSICSLLEENVTAIISASGSTLTAFEADLARQFHIPYMAAVATDPYLRGKNPSGDYVMFLSPSDKYQSQAIFDVLNHFGWYEFSILASADDYGIHGLVYLQYLATRDSNFNIRDVQHFPVDRQVETDVLDELRLIKSSLARVIVLNCDGDFAKTIFRDAKNMGLMGEGFVWIVTDAITGQPETLAYNGSFPTYYRGLIGTVPVYGADTQEYNSFRDEYIMESGGSSSDIMIPTILVSDAITIIHESLSKLDGTDWDSKPSLSCSSAGTWDGGDALLSILTEETFSVLSGDISFDDGGESRTTQYDIMNFHSNGFEKVGGWNTTAGFKLNNAEIMYLDGLTTTPTGMGNTLTGFHLRVGIVQEPPIAYKSESCVEETTSPACWYGWNPDIIKKLAKDLNFTYEYLEPEDMKYGGFDPETQTWNGMVKDILDRRTDLTIALSINVERSSYIDFTLSFFEDQAAFIVFSDAEGHGNIFFFLLPFKNEVWLMIFAIIAVIALLVTLFSKLSPYGKYGRKIHALQTCPCRTCWAKRELKSRKRCSFSETNWDNQCHVDKVDEYDSINDMSFYNAIWIVSTGFVQQGGETLPHAPSGRFLLFFWWLFVMILVSMYTANLTAHLTLERARIDITSLFDLLEQSAYGWGVISDRNLESMMKNHGDPKYVQLVDSGTPLLDLDDGMRQVQEGMFVFIDEGSVLSFNFKDNCTALQTNTGKFGNEWAFGLQPNSPYANVINGMFLRYREEGWFTDCWDQWYKSEGVCASDTKVGSDMQFDLKILCGLFAIFAMGILCSFVMVILETLYASYRDSKEEDTKGFWKSLKRRLKYKCKEMKEEWMGIPKKEKKGDKLKPYHSYKPKKLDSSKSVEEPAVFEEPTVFENKNGDRLTKI